ncbi:thiol reductant ABC exporter subunit CydC [Actinoplanes sp. NPDC026670]|uniref:thiol reductant ABC exporter subunit CydC n=1 Tax=Actinoplanes sp. NPDC026670 TaxID=3154700 RepID=UPI0033E852DE
MAAQKTPNGDIPRNVSEPPGVRQRGGRGPVDPRLLRHARASRGGIALLSLIGFGQALATIMIATALCAIVTTMAGGTGALAGTPLDGLLHTSPDGLLPTSLDGFLTTSLDGFLTTSLDGFLTTSLDGFLTTSTGLAIGLLAAGFAGRAALAWAEQVTAQRTAARVTDELRQSLLDRVVRRGPAWVAAYGPGRLTTVLGTGLEALRPWFSGYLPALVLGVLLPPLVVVIMAVVDPASAIVALLTIPLLPLLGALIGWATKARAEQRWAADSRLAGHFLDVVRGLPTLRMYGRAHRQIDVIADLTDRHRAATMRVLRVAFLSSTALDLVGTLAVGLIAVQAGLRVAAGSMELGPALLVILLAPEAYRPLREMAARYHASTDATAVIADVDEILTTSGPWDVIVSSSAFGHSSPREPGVAGRSPRSTVATPLFGRAASGRWGVRAAGVRARYPGAFEDALDLPELTVRAGELVALRGVSGAGKTTALRVLAGLHPAESGAVAVGRMFHLPQRPALPHARTVAEAFPPGTSPAEVRNALLVTGLTGELTDETALGEQAAGISAGQRQRLALAVLLHRAAHAVTADRARGAGPVVTLLLDEPTAHLDSTAEQLVISRLHDLVAQGCAVLVVAHRPALLAAADRIVTLHPPAGTVLSRATPAAGHPGPRELSSRSAHPTPEKALACPDLETTQPSVPSSRENATGPDHCERTPETTETTGREDAAGSDDCERAPETTETASREHAAGSDRCDEVPETAVTAGWWRRLWVAAGLGAGSSIAGIVLTGAAAWLLVRASSLPPVLSLSAAVVLVRGSAVARPLLRYLERLVSHEVAFGRLGQRRAAVFARLIPHVPGPRLHRRGDLLTRLVDDVDATTDGLLRGRLPVVAAAVTAAAGLVVLAGVAWEAAVPVAVGLLVAGVLAPAVAGRLADRQEAVTGAARAALRDAVVETVDGVEELGGGGGRLDVPKKRSSTLADLEARAAREAGFAAAVAHAGWGAAAVGVAVVLARGGLVAEWSAVVLLGVIVLGEAVVSLPEAAIARRRAAGAGRRVAALIENGPAPCAEDTGANRRGTGAAEDAGVSQDSTGAAENTAGPGGAVRLEGLVAGWVPGRAPVLDGVTLELAAGSRTAIMGRSGCGKSTLGAVLAGLLTPQAGTVRVSGTAVLVGEETGHVFASTVRENLRLASPAATDEQLRAVLARAGLGWMDLDSWLGAGGGTISGGQRRRLATARALLADPALLILDEPTEGIDEAGARDLMADLLDAAAGRTVLVLAHRTEGLDLVDRVLELDPNGLKVKNVGLDRSVL